MPKCLCESVKQYEPGIWQCMICGVEFVKKNICKNCIFEEILDQGEAPEFPAPELVVERLVVTKPSEGPDG